MVYNGMWPLPDSEARMRCLRDIGEALDRLSEPHRAVIEDRDLKEIEVLSVSAALEDPRARVVSVIVQRGDFWIRVKGALKGRPVTVTMHAQGTPPKELLQTIEEVIRRYSGVERRRWYARLWTWFRLHVWGDVVAGLIVMVVGALPFVAPLITK